MNILTILATKRVLNGSPSALASECGSPVTNNLNQIKKYATQHIFTSRGATLVFVFVSLFASKH